MTLSEDIRKIFNLDEAENRILTIMVQGKPNMTPYLVWKETRRLRKEIPQRTVYGKFRRLREGGYIVEVGKQSFKRAKVKRFFELTLKGMLAALADEETQLQSAVIERFRKALHIPQEYEKALRAIVSIWADDQSKVPSSDRGKIDASSVRKVIYRKVGNWWALKLSERFVAKIERAKKSLGITDQEYEALISYFVTLTAFVAGRMDFEKRVLPFGGSSILPTPWFSDCVQISPILGIRLLWSPPKCEGKVETSSFGSWLSVHASIAAAVAGGSEDRLYQYMKELSSKLQFNWIPYCLKREHDGECVVNNAPCPHTSILECGIVRENSKEKEQLLNSVIKEIPRALQS